MKNAAKEEKRKRQTEDLNAVSEYEGEKLTQKEINRRKLAAQERLTLRSTARNIMRITTTIPDVSQEGEI